MSDDDRQDTGAQDDGVSQDDGGQLPEELRKILEAERGRMSKQFAAKLAAETKRIRAEAEAELQTRLEREQMDELSRTKAELEEARSKLAARERAAAELEARMARIEFINQHAGGLDRAWRVYLERELAAAGEDESPEDVLKRVLEEHAQETGQSRPPSSVGTGGRPAPTTAPQSINDRIRRAAGR